jgi:integrase/recombinase XerD
LFEAMVLGGPRLCEVLGLRLEDLRVGQCRVSHRRRQGGHERIVPVSSLFVWSVAAYLGAERPLPVKTDRVFRLDNQATPSPRSA